MKKIEHIIQNILKAVTALLCVCAFQGMFGIKVYFNKITTGTPGTALTINSSTITTLTDGDTLQINAGVYTDLTISGIHKHIVILGTGVTVDFAGSTEYAQIESSSQFELYDVYFHHGTFRGLELAGRVDSCLIKVSFRNFQDYVLFTTGLTYDGTSATRNNSLDLQITSDSSSYAPVLRFGNRLWQSHIHNCHIDSVIGTPIQMTEFFGWNVFVHDNVFSKINMGGTNHNSIIYAAGQFYIYNNVCIDYQGEMRLRPYTMDSTATHKRDTSYCWNNFFWNSAKYAMAELQQFSTDTTTNTDLPNVRIGDIWFFNNTGGRMRDLDFSGGGCLVTLEGYFGRGLIKNNVIVFPRTDADQSGLTSVVGTVINNQAGTLGHFDTAANKFYLTWGASGLLDSTVGRISTTSPLVNAGVTIPGFLTDADGRLRPQGMQWDIGRSEAVLNTIGDRTIKQKNIFRINKN